MVQSMHFEYKLGYLLSRPLAYPAHQSTASIQQITSTVTKPEELNLEYFDL